MGTVVMTDWGNFLHPPPPLHHYPQFPQHSADPNFWYPLEIFLSGIVSAVTSVCLPWKNPTKFKAKLSALTVVIALITVVLAICYEWQRSTWTFNYHGETVLMGDCYTPAGNADPRDGRDDWFGDFGGNSSEVWTEECLWQTYLLLGLVYLLAGSAAGVTFALASWIGSLVAAQHGSAKEHESG
jgi:hypothetical protein